MGWSDSGERQLQSVIDDPHEAQQIAGQSFGDYRLGGDQRGGRREKWIFPPDGGSSWNPCQIFSNPMPSQVWAFWRCVGYPSGGKHEIQVRATDANGKVQPASRSGSGRMGLPGITRLL